MTPLVPTKNARWWVGIGVKTKTSLIATQKRLPPRAKGKRARHEIPTNNREETAFQIVAISAVVAAMVATRPREREAPVGGMMGRTNHGAFLEGAYVRIVVRTEGVERGPSGRFYPGKTCFRIQSRTVVPERQGGRNRRAVMGRSVSDGQRIEGELDKVVILVGVIFLQCDLNVS